jgi:hypothetical protein
MKSLKSLATALSVLLAGALVSDPAFASRGGHRGGSFHGGHFKAQAGHFRGHGGHFATAHGGHFYKSRVVVGVGVGFPVYWGYYSYPYPYYAPYYYPYYYPPAYYPSAPTTYVERGNGPAAAPQPAAEHWWYYCAGSRMYYPYTKECPGGWQRVSPQPPPPN